MVLGTIMDYWVSTFVFTTIVAAYRLLTRAFEDKYEYGRRPYAGNDAKLRNVHKQEMDFLRGYMVHFGAGRSRGNVPENAEQLGATYKDAICEPGGWHISMMMQGETIPKITNQVKLSDSQKDAWGIPLLITDVDYDENDEKLLKDFLNEGVEMLSKAGAKNIVPHDSKQAPGWIFMKWEGVAWVKIRRLLY
jgi:hypothetical protein